MSYTVTNGNDSGEGSLRNGLSEEGILEINFDPGVTTVTLTSGELLINSSVTINGSGMGGIEITRDSETLFGIFYITNAIVNMSGLTISNGIANTGSGILIEGNSNVNLDHCIITRNLGSYMSSESTGGGIYIFPDSSLNVSYCEISSNTSGYGGALYCGSTFTIRNSLLFNNQSNSGGGAIFSNGPVIGNIYNSTIAGNNTFVGGAMYIYDSSITIINSTITNNTSISNGGGIYNPSGLCTVGNTIIAGNNSTFLSTHDVYGDFNSLGYNIIGITTGSTGFGVIGDILNTDAMLGTLGNYGGPTRTIPLQKDSPALGAANFDILPDGENIYDQRGPPFPRQFNGQTDIGAFEDQSFICYSGKSKILTRNILTNVVSELNAEDVISDLHEVYDVINQEFIPVKFNIVTRKTTRFMLIKTNLIGPDQPFDDFYVTSGHKLLINGEKIKARHVKGAIRVKVNPPETLYSICTLKATVILINGLSVATWGYDNWIRYSKSNVLVGITTIKI